jgi:hypothetical protein
VTISVEQSSADAERAATHGAWHDMGLVFTREDGGQLHPEHVADTFQRIHQRAGLPPIRLHDLRHTARASPFRPAFR